MEIFTAMAVAGKCRDFLSITTVPITFLNVNMQAYFMIHVFIIIAKFSFAWYSTKFLIPKYLIAVIVCASLINVLHNISDVDILFTIVYHAIALAVFWFHDYNIIFSFASWWHAAIDTYFQVLLDVLTVISTVFYVFKFYAEEVEKALLMIYFTLCLDWCIDWYQGQNPLKIIDVIISLSFQILSLIALKPLRRRDSNFSYGLICGTLLVWLIYKYYIIMSRQGWSKHLFEYPHRNSKDEDKSATEIYVYDTIMYYGVYSMFFQEVKEVPHVTSIELYLNNSLPSLNM